VSYRVELPVFSGPMDLLLHLVKQSEVDIHEVSIAPILADFLSHVKVLEHLDLHDIGDFVVMSSTLMEIKSRELLPNESVEIEEELDPRDDLIRRLLEYKRYRDLARELDTRSGRRQRQSNLVMPQPPELKSADDEDLLDLGQLGIWDLTAAFAKLLEEVGQHQSMEIEVEMRDVGYYTHVLLDTFKKDRQVKFSDVFDPKEGRYGMIGTLIALLEMMKQGYLRALQENCFDEISLAYIGADDVTADLILAGITAEEMREDMEKAAKAAAEAAKGEADDGDGLLEEEEEVVDDGLADEDDDANESHESHDADDAVSVDQAAVAETTIDGVTAGEDSADQSEAEAGDTVVEDTGVDDTVVEDTVVEDAVVDEPVEAQVTVQDQDDAVVGDADLPAVADEEAEQPNKPAGSATDVMGDEAATMGGEA
jgi:segregation and condensation protein A